MTSQIARAILIVEDEPAQARMLATALGGFGYGAVATAATAEQAFELISSLRPQLALIDIALSGPVDGVQVAERMREQGITVIFVTGYPEGPDMERAMRTRPSGYLLKPVRLAELRAAIEIALHDRAARAAPGSFGDSEGPGPAASLLSRREIEVLRLFAHGLATKEVAARLGIAKPTVETYRTRIAEKLGVNTRAELVAFATRMGLAARDGAGS